MAKGLLRSLQVMNLVSVFLFVVCSVYLLCHHGNADNDGGALSLVPQDNQDNGEVTVELENEDDELSAQNLDPFHPTNDWKTVKEGQSIPAGLHVRMNMETGHREAKLMDGDSKYQYWKDGDRAGMMNMDRKQFSMEELKRALQDFKTTQLDDTDLQREEEVKKKFRDYKQLKQDFVDMNMDIKTDAEILSGLLERMTDKATTRDNLITVLTDLEYYLHQIDNGMLFRDMGGLPHLLKLVNRTEDEQIQMEAATVLGAAMSSNPKVQIGALEAGALDLLLRLLSTGSSDALCRKTLYALSAQCRHFPFAQESFLALGGLSVLEKLFEDVRTEKLKVKTLAFLNDLLMEKVLIDKYSSLDKSSEAEKFRQYQDVALMEGMIENDWCSRIPKLLALPDHDSTETTLNIMSTLAHKCQNTFNSFQQQLTELQSKYLTLAKEDREDEDGYFNSIAHLVKSVLEKTNARQKFVHDGSEF